MNTDKFNLLLTDEAKHFINNQPEKASYKIYYNIKRVLCGEVNNELFKKLDDTRIWEFRTLYNKISYRVFAFWDTEENTLIVATHGIVKKTQKTPLKDIEKAEIIRKEYFNTKKQNKK